MKKLTHLSSASNTIASNVYQNATKSLVPDIFSKQSFFKNEMANVNRSSIVERTSCRNYLQSVYDAIKYKKEFMKDWKLTGGSNCSVESIMAESINTLQSMLPELPPLSSNTSKSPRIATTRYDAYFEPVIFLHRIPMFLLSN